MMQKLLRQLFGFVLQLFFQYEGRPQTILFAPRTASMIAASPVKGFGEPSTRQARNRNSCRWRTIATPGAL